MAPKRRSKPRVRQLMIDRCHTIAACSLRVLPPRILYNLTLCGSAHFPVPSAGLTYFEDKVTAAIVFMRRALDSGC